MAEHATSAIFTSRNLKEILGKVKQLQKKDQV
jgi:hypothetical protein